MFLLKTTPVILLSFVLFSSFQCSKHKEGPPSFRGRLEVKAPCGHYIISVLKGRIDTSMFQTSWTDPTTGKTFKNVFAVANSCSFPAKDLNEGDEFSFTLGGKPQNCMVCLLYYPTPEKKMMIAVTKILKHHSQPSTSQ